MDLQTLYGLILLWMFIPIFTCFNLEPRAAIVFQKPKFPPDSNRQSGDAGRQINLDEGRPSYFGYSVALLKSHADNKASVLVGAPRANSSMYKYSEIKEPGAFYKCDVTQRGCQEVRIDPDGNIPPNTNTYVDMKDNGWLGSALDSQTDGRQASAVCAGRLKNTIGSYNSGRLVPFRHISGKCYWFNSTLTDNGAEHELTPLTNNRRQYFTFKGIDGEEHTTYDHAHGQAGMAVHFPEHVNNTEMLIGAPGVLNWKGSLIRVKDYGNNFIEPGGNRRKRAAFENHTFSEDYVPNPYYTNQIDDFDYFGYSVSSGKIDNGPVYYVGGSPRGGRQRGKVLVFQYPYQEYQNSRLRVKHAYIGGQLGEYFGGSVAMLDANGDGFDELVVGAPLHALPNKADVGRIHYFHYVDGRLQPSTSVFVGRGLSGSRFGTTLAVIGDLNNDGYQDLAVGAPWEDNGIGAVYIYMGSQNGLRPKYYQRLSPSQFEREDDLRGFGMSLSRGVDVDENHYPDLGIGSFASGHAVLIRSRPTARVTATLKAIPDKIELNATALKLEACLDCRVQHSTKNIKLNVTLSLDHKFHTPRAKFKGGDSSQTFEMTVITAADNQQECKDFNIDLSNLRIDPYQALQMKMEYKLIENTYNLPDQAEELIKDPIIDHSDGVEKNLEVGIVTGCEGDGDDTCSTDLRVASYFKDYGIFAPFTVGKQKSLPMIINVTNLDEPAFLPNLTVTVDEPLKLYLPRTHLCERPEEYNGRKLYCKLNNPLTIDKKDDLSVNVDVSGLTDQKSSVSLHVSVNSEGVETSPNDASNNVTLNLHGDASLKMFGNSRGENVFYPICDNGKVNTTDQEVRHIIKIHKEGATPISKVDIDIEIPTYISNIELKNNFLQLDIEKAKFGDQEIICKMNGIVKAKFEEDYTSLINLPGLSTDGNFTKSEHNRTRRSTNKRYRAALKREVMDDFQNDDPALALDCDKVGIRCGRISCPVGPWLRISDYVLIELRIKLNMTVLAQHMPAMKGAVLMTHARAVIKENKLNITGNRDVGRLIKTVIQPLIAAPQSISWWWILLAILAGILLLGLLTYALYKSGFFKRAKKEEMEGMRATVSTNDKTNLVES